MINFHEVHYDKIKTNGHTISSGDPTVFGNLSPPKEAVDAVVESVTSGKHNGYVPAVGRFNIYIYCLSPSFAKT